MKYTNSECTGITYSTQRDYGPGDLTCTVQHLALLRKSINQRHSSQRMGKHFSSQLHKPISLFSIGQKFAACSEKNTKHMNTLWTERTVLER